MVHTVYVPFIAWVHICTFLNLKRCVTASCANAPPFALFVKEITKNAVFVEDTIGTTDICQGQLGESIKKKNFTDIKMLLFIEIP